jgi:hypothetical protein
VIQNLDVVVDLSTYLFSYLDLSCLTVRMLGEPTELENSIEEVLKKFMVDIAMSEGLQASLTRGLQASPSTGHCSGCVNPTTEQRSNQRGDMVNVKQIPSILLDYIPLLAGMVNRDRIPHDYEYILITAYILKGICIVGIQLGQIPLLKNNEFNMGDRKNYVMLTPHRYLMKMTGKKPRLVSQHGLRSSHSPNWSSMKISHFGHHQEVNACVKLLLLCYHGGYLWLDWWITVDPVLIHLITGFSMHRPDPQHFYPGKASDHSLAQHIKEAYDKVEKGKRGYKVASI